MGVSNKNRQAAFKERMRLEGKVMRTLWLDEAQESAVKAFIAGKQLPVTNAADENSLKARVAELESQVVALTDQMLVARNLEQQAQQECSSLRAQHQVAARDMQRLSEELKAAQKASSKAITLSAPKAGERAKVLLEQIDQRTTWRGEKSDRDAYDTRQAAERLAGLVRQAKAARTAIAKAEQELADVVSEGEKEVLDFARLALSQIIDAAEIAKESGRRLAKKREDHEESCRIAAHKAVTETFQPESIEDKMLLITASGKPDRYTSAYDLLIGDAFKRTYRDARGREYPQDILSTTLANAVRETLEGLVGRIGGVIMLTSTPN